jgi:hypothetical protein
MKPEELEEHRTLYYNEVGLLEAQVKELKEKLRVAEYERAGLYKLLVKEGWKTTW